MDLQAIDGEIVQESAGKEAAETGPELLAAGSFAIYKSPKGELVIVTDIEGRGVERKVFSRRMVKMAWKFFKVQSGGIDGLDERADDRPDSPAGG